MPAWWPILLVIISVVATYYSAQIGIERQLGERPTRDEMIHALERVETQINKLIEQMLLRQQEVMSLHLVEIEQHLAKELQTLVARMDRHSSTLKAGMADLEVQKQVIDEILKQIQAIQPC